MVVQRSLAGSGLFTGTSRRRRSRFVSDALWLALLALGLRAEAAPPSVTSFQQLYALPKEQAEEGRPVRIKGIVVCYDPGWGQLYVHDGARTIYMEPTNAPPGLKKGDQVELTANTTLSSRNPDFTNIALNILGESALPKPEHLELGQLGQGFGQWVETSGTVRTVDLSSGRLVFRLRDKGTNCLVYVMGPPTTNNFKWLIDEKVSVRGINASKLTNGVLSTASIFAPSISEVKIIEHQKTSVADLSVTSIDTLLTRKLDAWTNNRVRISGLIASYVPGKSLVVKDPTGWIRAQVTQDSKAGKGDRVNVWGFLRQLPDEAILDEAFFEGTSSMADANVPVAQESSLSDTNGPVTLSAIAQVVQMRPATVSQGKRVRVRGVVTFADPDWHNGFIQDPTGAIYFDLLRPDVRIGQWIEVEAQTAPGGFAPQLNNCHITILGTTNLPIATKVDLSDLASGRMDSRWLEMEGVVRRVIPEEEGHTRATVMTRQGSFQIIMPVLLDKATRERLVDALVKVRGACTSAMNARGQLKGIELNVPSLEHIQVLESVSQDLFDTKPTTIESVAGFNPDRLAGRRVKVSGIVTLVLPGKSFYIQDDTGGIKVNTDQAMNLKVGDVADVLGFPAMGEFSPTLEEPALRVTGTAPRPAPIKTSAEQILSYGTNDGMMVRLDARLLQKAIPSSNPKLVLQDGSVIFTAHLGSSRQVQTLTKLSPGSLIRLTAICSIQGGDSQEIESFRLLLPQAESVLLLSSPPWWTPRYTLMLLGGVSLGVVAAGAWSSSLRRQVRQQTETIRKNQRDLLEISRRAGRAEVATSVLHNVGNVLNSVNVSGNLIEERLRQSKTRQLRQIVTLVSEHSSDLGEFITRDPKGTKLPKYLGTLTEYLIKEEQTTVNEVSDLLKNIEHIKSIVTLQQSYAGAGGVSEKVKAVDLMEDAIRMNQDGLEQRNIRVVREYSSAMTPEITIERHKVLQILVNLIQNAKHACVDSGRSERLVHVRMTHSDGNLKMSVIDNGVGIAAENLTRIFNHGFTTRKNGHGFGLHSGALAAQEMGGSLVAYSAGPGKGASFTLELPLIP